MSAEHDRPFPVPPTPDLQDRFVKAARATAGVNVPAEALTAIAAYIAEPVENLISVEGDCEQLKSDRLSDLVSDAGIAKVLTIELLGCAGSVWEHNERQSTSWASAADPTASESDAALPLLSGLSCHYLARSVLVTAGHAAFPSRGPLPMTLAPLLLDQLVERVAI